MRTWVLAIALTALPLTALANNRDFVIYNETPSDIATVYFSTYGYNRWVPSSRSYVTAGDSARLSFGNDGPCEMQLRIHFTNGDDAEWSEGFNFCTVSQIVITGSTGRYNARYH